MRVAVVTPYYRTPDAWLRMCHESVRAQTHPCTHILVADGIAQEIVQHFDSQHIVLSQGHADYGDTPRAIGSMSAIGQGFDAITYLDADNWYEPDHISSLVELHRSTGSAICTSMRNFHHVNGQKLATCLSSDGEIFCDTNCLMLFRSAFSLCSVWALMEPDEHAIDDRVVWYRILQSGASHAHSRCATLAYRATHAGIYKDLGLTVPQGVKNGPAIGDALQRWEAKGNPPLKVNWRYSVPQRKTE